MLIAGYENGNLTGVFALAKNKHKQIFGAGGSMAEYQCWISNEENSKSFFLNSIKLLEKNFINPVIHIKYIPFNAPVHWLKEDGLWNRALLKTVRQPIMEADEDKLAKELKKKNRREKLNRLRRLGDLKFIKISSQEEFNGIINELAVQSDFRKGAMVNKCAFLEDHKRVPFLKKLFSQNLLHATILKVGDEIIASNIGTIGKGWLHLQGLNTHSPSYAKHSPGILHFLMLGKMLAEENDAKIFDLTPGKDTYKDILATDVLDAYELVISSPFKKKSAEIAGLVRTWALKQIQKIGFQPETLKKTKKILSMTVDKFMCIKKHGFINTVPELIRNKGVRYKLDHYRFISSNAPLFIGYEIEKNNLKSLVNHRSSNPFVSRWEFLMDAMKRFEKGQQCFTYSRDGILQVCMWAAGDNPDNLASKYSDQNKEPSVVFELAYCHPGFNKEFARFFTSAMRKRLNASDKAKIYLSAFRSLNPYLPKQNFQLIADY